ncbi:MULTISPECIES: hypothetical protein [unclassified Microbacterium]|uniref:hypothetical protein n=1 Tax=unclassified Microbacterium TaxID=2609290 RepID=UPI002468B2E0|nr:MULTISPECIES: hypothetical protein [unclassified Microbacterium]MDH5134618.1 hypothetical protein [Microbacterium sp. RD10]MDH5138172.1 hypothetical protein [Microbacterium sp. RD11]MDH5146108.1 hypothetical protein [Microbacterium sp. RD12]MDH5156157.1 hypothetical protein [Microbacterium sp. RD06]MDH5168099.1 hypothetical protein [Microbacterium sp. RD02]
MSRGSGLLGYVEARADRLAAEQASAARSAAIKQREEAATEARAAATAAQRHVLGPKPPRQVSLATAPVSGAHNAARRSDAPTPRVVVNGTPITDPRAIALLSRF